MSDACQKKKKYEYPSGIYTITHRESGKNYVGSAACLRRRWSRHLYLLRRNRHDNIHLQRAWDLYGEIAFDFEIVEYVHEKSMLIPREKHWFDVFDVIATGYNLSPVAGSKLGTKHSEETKKKISATQKGKIVSEETRRAMSASSKGRKLTDSAKKNLSSLAKIRWQNPEYRANHISKLKGRKLNPDSIVKREATRARNRILNQDI